MKRVFYCFAIIILIFISCGCSGSESGHNADTIQNDSSSMYDFDFNETGFVGSYQFTDEKGVTCTIVLKDDNTFTAQSSKSDDIKTGTWVVYNNECPQLKFDATDEPLFFTFPEGKEQKIKQTINDGVISENGYIYAMSIYYDAKKEDKRLPITRVN